MKRVLIATDGSSSAREAIEHGLELAVEQKAEVTLLHVIPPLVSPGLELAAVTAIEQEVPEPSEDPVLVEAAAQAKERGVSADLRVSLGSPAAEIVAIADEIDADIVVVGSRGLGAVSGALLGSVSHGVLKHSKRPVLVIRATAA
jgi:nucleotide-binding universal stress UspA family protein